MDIAARTTLQGPYRLAGGYFIYGYTDSGPQATFARSLPIELQDTPEQEASPGTEADPDAPPVTTAPNHMVCECGATIAAVSHDDALKALAEHKDTLSWKTELDQIAVARDFLASVTA